MTYCCTHRSVLAQHSSEKLLPAVKGNKLRVTQMDYVQSRGEGDRNIGVLNSIKIQTAVFREI